MTKKAFSNGLLSIVDNMSLPAGYKFDRKKLWKGEISLAVLANNNKDWIYYNDGTSDGQANEFTTLDGTHYDKNGFYRVTYSNLGGRDLTVDRIQSILGYHEYFGHGVMNLSHDTPGVDAELDCIESLYPFHN